MAINGTNFAVFERDQAIGFSQSCTLNLSQDLPEKTNKDSNGWVELLPGLRSAEITVTGLTNYDSALNFEELADRIITRTMVTYVFKYGNHYVWGYGLIQDAEEIAGNDQAVEFAITIKLWRYLYYGLLEDQLPWDLIFTNWENMLLNWENV
jgi:predicted secreted protein